MCIDCEDPVVVVYFAQRTIRRWAVSSHKRRYYDDLWSRGKVIDPSVWALWDTILACAVGKTHLLEIGAGNRPRIPIVGSYFVDLSINALATLREREGKCASGSADALPFPDESFDLVCAFEIVEHVPDDEAVLREVARVLKKGERFIFSVPLHMEQWTRHDDLAGHVHRYEPAALESQLGNCGMVIERYNITPSPRNSCYRNLSAYVAAKFWRLSVAMEERIALPIYTWFDRRRGIRWEEGSFAEGTERANNVIVVCEKQVE
jgi:SAM-dependent methyltransferase